MCVRVHLSFSEYRHFMMHVSSLEEQKKCTTCSKGSGEIRRASESRECFALSLTQNESSQGRFERVKESSLIIH